jgi:hypothetical protein
MFHTLRFSTLRFTELDAQTDIRVNTLYSSQTFLKTLHLDSSVQCNTTAC